MDVPVLTAVIGVSGTLLGTIVGGCLTTFTNLLLQKRRERVELRVGCRLLASELQESEHVISVMLEFRGWWSSEIQPVKAWDDYRHVLASYLPYETWATVQRAVVYVRSANQRSAHACATEERQTMVDVEIEWVADCVEGIRKGLSRRSRNQTG
jgi:hypothetical protein